MKKQFQERRQSLEKSYANDETLPLHSRIELGVYSFFHNIVESDIMIRSAALSYTLAFSLVPLVTTVIAFLTAFPGLQVERERLMNLISSQLLPSAVQSVQSYLAQFADRAAAAGAVSSLLFFVVVLMLFQAMESALNDIWRVNKARTWGERLRTLAVLLISGAIAMTLFVIVSGIELWGIGRHFAGMSAFITNLLAAWALFSIANRVLPSTKVKWRFAILGGVIVGTFWHFLKSGFTLYIEKFATSYENIYGTLGTIPILFLWIFLSFLLLLTGSYISFVAQELKVVILERRAKYKDHPRTFYAVAVAAILAQAFEDQEGPLSISQITQRLQTPSHFVVDALAVLCAADLVLSISESEQYVLIKPSETIALNRIAQSVESEFFLVPEKKSNSEVGQVVEHVFKENHDRLASLLGKISIADIANEARKTLMRSAG